jgi:uncharacterized protein (TIGR02186 family)
MIGGGHRAVFAALFAALIWTATSGRAAAEDLVTAISSKTISIESNFTGAEIVLFGTIERDAATVARPQGYDIVIAARGPAQSATVRQKQRLAGIWINLDSRHYVSLPSYVAYLSNRLLSDIADPLVLTRFQLGLRHLILLQEGSPAARPDGEAREFRNATLRLMRNRARYLEEPYSVRFLTPRIFTARIPLPATIPTGTYSIEVYLFGDGAMLERAASEIFIRKSGLEQVISRMATQMPLLYGLAAVALAIFAGWFAGIVFRRD